MPEFQTSTANGDEHLYANRIGNFPKRLPHNQLGEVDLNVERDRFRPIVAALAIGVVWLLGLHSLHAQGCALASNGMCAKPTAGCSPIDNPDESNASTGVCTTKVGTHPVGNTCRCLGKLKGPPAGTVGAMDVLPHAVKPLARDPQWDDNNFLRNPVWRFAKEQNGTIPDLCAFCPCDSDQPTDWNKRPSCTSQSLFSEASLACGYHMNWFPVEYEGFIDWAGKSSFIEDNDYTFSIHRDRGAINDRALETTSRPGVHLEFDSSETVNHFDNTNTWWDNFHHNSVDHNDEAAREAINDKFAMVIGLLGIDSQHNPHTEIHPVYAIFVKLPGSQPTEDKWGFFVRNFGNEGYCGSDSPLPLTALQVRIPGASGGVGTINRATLTSWNVQPFSDNNPDRCRAVTQWGFQGASDGGLLFTFRLSDPADKCGFVGDLTVNWQQPVITPSALTKPGPSVAAPPESDIEDPVLSAKISKLNPTDRQQLEKQIAELRDAQTRQPAGPPMEPAKLSQVKHPPVKPGLPNYGKDLNLKPVNDPAAQTRQEKKRQLIDAFLKAHGIE